MAHTTWSDDRVEQLKQLHAEGYSASVIAEIMGLITRNAVIGKVHRLNMPYPRLAVLGHLDPTPKPLPQRSPDDYRALARGPHGTLLALQPWDCRYPIGDPQEPNFFFCSAEVFGRSYCVDHYRRCYGRTPVQITHEERVRRHYRALKNIDRIKKGLVA